MTTLKRAVWLLILLLGFLSAGGGSRTAHAHTINAWVISSGGKAGWRKINGSLRPIESLRFGDFDGNGKADVFSSWGGKWYVSYDGTGQWTRINSSQVAIENLRFGRFDNNNKTDVFTAWGGKWYVSYDGTGQWTNINSSQVPISDLLFGNFVGNTKTDVLAAWGGKWYVSESGTGGWQQINSSSYGTASLRAGKFRGEYGNDAFKHDIFRTDGSKWYVSYDGTGQWTYINASNIALSDLGFADFDGDGLTDIFAAWGGSWYVSEDGTGTWEKLNTSNVGRGQLRFADFDGDRKADVFNVAAEAHIGLSIIRHTSTPLDDATADAILASATNVLQTVDGPGDVTCLAHLSRSGAVTVFTLGDGSIDSAAEESAVRALPGFVKVVNMINFCGEIKAVSGCAPSPGSSMTLARTTADLEGAMWLHEYGHTRGLGHSDDSDYVMFKTVTSQALRVSASECNSYRK